MNQPSFRDQFALGEGIYLLNHSVGRMPKQVSEAVQQRFLDVWATSQSEPWQQWLSCIDEFKNELAALFNAQAGDFCPQSNLSSGLVKVLGAYQRQKPNAVLLASENDFPSMGFALQQAEQLGLKLKWLPKNLNLTELNTWEAVLTEDVDIVFVSHVHYNTNARVPVEGICHIATERNIFSIVDVAQSAGVVPIDFSSWSADVVLGSCVKWLCGGPGAGFLWTGSEQARLLEPVDVGWFSHANPFEFKIHKFSYADNANRYWGGTPSVLPFVVASSSISFIRSIGIETIYAHNRELTKLLIEAFKPNELVTPSSAESRGGTLVVNPVERQDVEKRLQLAKVQFDSRAMGLRLSPHIYNTLDEMSIVADCFR